MKLNTNVTNMNRDLSTILNLIIQVWTYLFRRMIKFAFSQ